MNSQQRAAVDYQRGVDREVMLCSTDPEYLAKAETIWARDDMYEASERGDRND